MESNVRAATEKKPIYLHVYHGFENNVHGYTFDASYDKTGFKRGSNIIRSVKVPARFDHLVRPLVEGGHSWIGISNYFQRGDLAESINAEPKVFLRALGIPSRHSRLGSFLLLIAETHLKKQGIKYLSTSDNPSPARISHVSKVGLQPRQAYRINDWLRATKRRMRIAAKR